MTAEPIVIGPDPPVFSFNRDQAARAEVAPGRRVRFVTSDASYRDLTGDALDSGQVSFRRLNALSGPVAIVGAEPGDALAVQIERIDLGETAYVPYVARWRSRLFGMRRSSITSYPIRDGSVDLGGGRLIRVRPMIGCAGVAPAEGELSALSPTGPTGGNMDLVELAIGATLWLPVQVPGALFSLGDIHAAMGRGESTGAGLECAGAATIRFALAKHQQLSSPRLETPAQIAFLGSDPRDTDQAIEAAIRAAWLWLTVERNVATRDALTLCSALLDVNLGGPAGANALAAFDRQRLAEAGVEG
ncbi:MAG: amidase [Thermomicrobiales bacterium]|nr:amidase [Thermomicrobiales bacterium]